MVSRLFVLSLFLSITSTALVADQGDFDAGFARGYETGYSKSFAEGDELGREEGRSAGYTFGMEATYQPAFDTAFESNYVVGAGDGWKSGFLDSFGAAVLDARISRDHVSNGSVTINGSSGISIGFDEWTTGHRTTIEPILTSYEQGYQDGLAQGEDEGYASGYSSGYEATYEDAVQSGSLAGQELGATEGTTAGHDAGFEFGVASGQDAGSQYGSNYTSDGGDLLNWRDTANELSQTGVHQFLESAGLEAGGTSLVPEPGLSFWVPLIGLFLIRRSRTSRS